MKALHTAIVLLLFGSLHASDTPAERFVAALRADDHKKARHEFKHATDAQRSEGLTLMFELVSDPVILVDDVRKDLARLLANPLYVSPAMWKNLEVPFVWKKWLLAQKGLENVDTKTPAGEKKEKQNKQEEAVAAPEIPAAKPVLGKNAAQQFDVRFEEALKSDNIDMALKMVTQVELAGNDVAPYLFRLIKFQWDSLTPRSKSNSRGGTRNVVKRIFDRLPQDARTALVKKMTEPGSGVPKEAIAFLQRPAAK